jgi:predicted metal-dependent enzyme (double-stranded beta helix superfamily)
MTLAPVRTTGTPGIDRFTPAQLLRTALLFVSNPALTTLLDPTSPHRQWVELHSTAHLQVWLIAWPAGTDTGWHDHGDAAGAFVTLQGSLREQTWSGGRVRERDLTSGVGRAFGSRHLHHVANTGPGTALSVHAYAPRLTRMTRYALTPTGPRRAGVTRVGADW